MPITVAVILRTLRHLLPWDWGVGVHGANLSISNHLLALLADERLESLQVFLEPVDLADRDALVASAAYALPERRRGQGVLQFYSVWHLPEIFGDGQERLMWCIDPACYAGDRAVRDRFATGPTPIAFDTHALGSQRQWRELAPFATAPHVAHDAVVCLSAAYQEAMERAFDTFLGGSRPCDFVTVPRGVDCGFFCPPTPAERAAAKIRLGIPANATVALYFARLTPIHKADLFPLLRAFARVCRSDDYLALVGPENSPGYCDALRNESRRLGISSRIVIPGLVANEDRPQVYAAGDFYVLPGDTLQEAFGTTVAEAMASGLPVICSDWDGFKDSVADGETGYLVPTYWLPATDRVDGLASVVELRSHYLAYGQCVWVDEEVLASRLDTLLHDQASRERMGRAARSRALERFSKDAVVDQHFAIYDRLLGLARAEDDEARERRRGFSDQLGLVRHPGIYDGYASGSLATQEATVALTDLGRIGLEAGLYDELLQMTHAAVFDILLSLLAGGTLGVNSLAAESASRSGLSEADIWFHIGVLAKRGLVSLTVGPR